MPELPEVETVRAGLAPVLEGRVLERVEIRDYRLTAPDDPRAVAAELEGERVAAVERRGKYLVIRFESGRALLSHLRMTGGFLAPANGDDPYTRAAVALEDGTRVTYRDVRRFGTWRLLEPDEGRAVPRRPASALEPLGPELTAGLACPRAAARAGARRSRGPCSTSARSRAWGTSTPTRRSGARASTRCGRPASSSPRSLRRLPRAIRDALRHGIARQGATLRDYRRPDGSEGGMQREFRAYGRLGEPCDRCGTQIEKIRVAGRGTWFCPACQPARAASSTR